MSRENQTPAERAMYAERARARNRLKMARRKAKKLAARAALPTVPGINKTDPTYRRRLPPLPGLVLKSELRAFLSQAVRNTAELVPA